MGEKITLGNSIKICVEPNYDEEMRKDEMKKDDEEIDQKLYQRWLKLASNILPESLIDSSSKVYFYNEGEKGHYTGFRFSKELIEDTKLCLQSKQEVRADLENVPSKSGAAWVNFSWFG